MVGYGDEDNHFVVELTYNYGIKNYKKGNDFQVRCLLTCRQHCKLIAMSLHYAVYQYLFQ